MSFYYEMLDGDVLFTKPDMVYTIQGPNGMRSSYRLAVIVNGAEGAYYFKTEEEANTERQKLIDYCCSYDEDDSHSESW